MSCTATADTPRVRVSRRAAWAAELRPVGAVESWLVDRAARAASRVDRLARDADAAELTHRDEERAGHAPEAARASKREDRCRRAELAAERIVHKSLGMLARGRKQALWVAADPAEEIVVSPTAEVVGAAHAETTEIAREATPRPEIVASVDAGRPSTAPGTFYLPNCTPIRNPEGDLPTALPTVHLRM